MSRLVVSDSITPWLIVYESLPDNGGVRILRIIGGRRDLDYVLGGE